MDGIGGGDLTQVRPRASRRRLPVGTRLDFWLDVVILVSYIFAYSYGFTGDVIHEWLGLALGAGHAGPPHPALGLGGAHHPQAVRRRGHDRVIWLVNLALLVGMTLCVVSGIVISRVALPSLGFFLTSNLFWNRLHILTAEITLGLVPVHAALRWRWIAGVGRRLLARRTGGPGQGLR